ncbi:ribosomal large subunit pseudouridine synthase D [Buchnera aphidicola str. Bp (Baizongia pistaciae)]|uniref:Ribosomal large subunit pseudouridine synthase D n=1 Tax=Buchnera aphidicola subsp. Baizongia pistaciae (strain Bp) TaxID=224915 RepID=RLUD_BUCBP|nr:23S rRNA pseudouridine(1911/1915/1917) synthase RluD [Buchnera aphidicola]Q89AD9.1 RecName: Full=Ribosomal large subunit pseudouridine synthase D; AltName: Full=23S rRNA pseudouridine(1911/1915/1917) synthase; AltName: Full=rRNA pseudouridylate synthase D; AltName: Full=rRNA-uridine isomerase D [Buchnera aphidicola str. Bp (Baizongia pistaciae)]AAO27082.1 ribosomal large subunit pseudouridine synthase D [Buchnera aphidicola str. Bp (Baizongia pistaciae)]
MQNKLKLIAIVPKISLLKNRLDQVLASLFKKHSRTILKRHILSKDVCVNGRILDQPDAKVLYKDIISINLKFKAKNDYQAENIFLNVIYEDDDILVINKQDNFVVHPGAGNTSGTLLNALLHRDSTFFNIPRAGIVHRLDKDTTGLMVIAKNNLSYMALIDQIKCKKVIREYQAIVYGKVISGGTIVKSIIRNPIKRTTMIVNKCGKRAITHYRILKRFTHHTHLKIILETGRTHQIRTHMLYINFPLVGDKTYGNKFKFYKNISLTLLEQVKKFPRQALHASRLCLYHPVTKHLMEWNSTLPRDMLNLIALLNKNI